METQVETIKVIHMCNQGFDWRIVVKENPEFPEQAILIQQHENGFHVHENGKMEAEVSLPKDALKPLQEVLSSFISSS